MVYLFHDGRGYFFYPGCVKGGSCGTQDGGAVQASGGIPIQPSGPGRTHAASGKSGKQFSAN